MIPQRWLAFVVAGLVLSCGGGAAPRAGGGGGPSLDAGPTDAPVAPPPEADGSRTVLRGGWHLQSSTKVMAAGATLSRPGFDDRGWIATQVPATVLAALVAAGVYKDPYRSDNLRRIPAADFAASWWYRREFDLPAAAAAEHVFLGFEGINYRANVWLNGQRVASETDVRGAYRTYRFEVTALIERGGKNALAVEVFRPGDSDLAINWWDWGFSPPDLDMGLFQDVYLRQTGKVLLEDLRVTTHAPGAAHADVSVTALVTNLTDQPQPATVAVTLGDRAGTQEVSLGAGETRPVVFDPGTIPALAMDNPPLWWPVGMGAQTLQPLSGKVTVAGALSDQRSLRVGLREVTSDTSTGSRLFKVNGQRIYLRGGGWASDLLLRWDPARLAAEMGYVLHLGLNMIRLEGKLEADAFYDRADELGIVLLPGWMCCDVWEMQGGWNDVQRAVARESMRSQAARLRNHPSVAAFLIGSDRAPPADVASAYTMALQSVGWPNPIINAASDEGGSGLKMTGPYDWVPPNFWYEDTENGGAFGFNSETGPGAAIPELETLRGFLGQAELDSLWMAPMATQFHAGTPGMSFDSLRIFQRALSSRLGAATSLEDWVSKAQLTNYEAERAEFESYGSRRYARATGLVHWLLNNSWPSLIWHLYDYSLLPAASFYGARKANEPLHPVLAYDDRSVQVVNNTQKAESGLTVTARVIDADGVERSSQDFPVSVMADASARAGVVAQPAGVTPLTFVDLELRRGDTLVSANTYWLSARKDLPDYDAGAFPTTPTSQFADFTALSRLAPATVKAAVTMTSAAGDARLAVTLENTSTKLAFFLRLLLRGAGGTPAVPVFWDDNYVTLRPGTRRTITVSAPAGAVGATPTVEVQGINVAKLAASP